jgi:hypothetical protein
MIRNRRLSHGVLRSIASSIAPPSFFAAAGIVSSVFCGCASTILETPEPVSSGQPGAAAQPDSRPISITFDTQAAQAFIDWANSSALAPPEGWQSWRPYALTRLWAQSSGVPDPDQEVVRALEEIARARREGTGGARLEGLRQLMRGLLERRQWFLDDGLDLLRTYLPEGTPIDGEVVVTLFIPPFAFTWIGDDVASVVIDLDSDFWRGDPDIITNLLVHEFFHVGFCHHQSSGSLNGNETVPALIDNILWQVQNEGMATYVGYRARTASLTIRDYQLMDTPDEVTRRFEMIRQLLADASRAHVEDIGSIEERLWNEGVRERAFYVVGATMARRIEESSGHERLVETVRRGPRAFFEEFAVTNPPAQHMLSVPVPSGQSVPEDSSNAN